jgi:hypothetical protein
MKKIFALASAMLIIPALCMSAEETAAQAKPETFVIIKHFDHAKKMSYKLLTQTELKSLQDEMAAETKFWDKAMAASEKAWKADTSTAKKSFPKTAISPKKMQILETYTDSEKATAKMNRLDEALADDEAADKKRAEEQTKRLTENARKMLGERATKKKSDSGMSDREALLDSARGLFENKMSELSTGMPGSQSPVATVAEPAADKNADKKKKEVKK